MSSLEALKKRLEELSSEYQQRLGSVTNEQELRKVYADFGGSHGAIRVAQKDALREAQNSDKKSIGQLSNEFVQKADALFEAALQQQKNRALDEDLRRALDVTLPGRVQSLGHLHPITLVRREIEQIFARIGFDVAEGPEVETEFHNFEALAMGKDHPARDMMDTFYIAGARELVLRTHTSPVQIRTMLQKPPPVRIIAPGSVYRKDDDPTHSPMFTQFECLCVDENVTFADLKGVLNYFVQSYFGASFGVRLRPSFFPFTEPSAEIDISCVFCLGKGCRTCKGSGWIEVGGSGMVDPEVFRHVGYDSERYTGFAFGMGIERMAMLRYRVNDIKLFYQGDVRFVRQFT